MMKSLRFELIENSPEYQHAIENTSDMILLEIIKELNNKYKLIIRGYYLDRKSVKDLAYELGYCSGYIYQLRIKALENIAEKCNGENHISKRLYRLLYHLDNGSEVYRLIEQAYKLSLKENKNQRSKITL